MNKIIYYTTLPVRTIVVSDIHGHLDAFKKLLIKVDYQPNQDGLIIIGDFIEKGPQILDTLHYMMELSKNKYVYILSGNCEWAIYEWIHHGTYIKKYMHRVSYSLLHEICDLHHINYDALATPQLQHIIQLLLKDELRFLETLTTILVTDDYVFVHAGIEDRKDYENSSISSLIEQQLFLTKQHPLDQYVVVGHLPTSNYHTHHIDNRIIIDQNKHMISIDGGMGVKEVCQLNALIIENNQFKQVSYIPFPQVRIIKPYYPGISHHHKVAWPNFKIQRTKIGHEFTKCIKVHNQESILIKNEYIYTKNNESYCKDDYEDYFIAVEPNDIVYYIKTCGQYAYIIKDHEVGWITKDCLGEFI